LIPPFVLCYILRMRKWMRERLQRRKKTAAAKPEASAPPPLQPAYFESEQPGDSGKASLESPAEAAAQPQASAEDRASEAQTTSSTARGSGSPARGRRRRGGRGRGGREQAVAQAFAPSATKESAAAPAEPVEELQPPDSEFPEAAEAETPSPAVPVPEAPKIPAPAAVARPPKGIVVLAIGLPGSDKSSWFKRHNVVPLSSDMVRSLLFDDVREQRFQDLVFSNLRSMLKARLIAKRPMNYVDATNLTPHERQNWIKLAKDYQYEVHAVFFDVPLEVCIERHQRRDRVVSEDVMRRMAAKLKPPTFEEGFAKITVVRVKKKEPAAIPE